MLTAKAAHNIASMDAHTFAENVSVEIEAAAHRGHMNLEIPLPAVVMLVRDEVACLFSCAGYEVRFLCKGAEHHITHMFLDWSAAGSSLHTSADRAQ